MTRRFGDLVAVLGWTLAAVGGVALVGIGPSPLRIALALPLVLLFPGYALLAALFPGSTDGERVGREEAGDARATLSPPERFSYAVVLSLAIVPAVAFALNFTGFGIRRDPLLVSVGGLTVLLTVVGFLTRMMAPPDRRHGLGLDRLGVWADRYLVTRRGGLSTPDAFVPATETQRWFNVLFLVGILVFGASVGYAAVTPAGDQEPFTELYLVQETDDGEFRSANLPTEFQNGATRTLWVGIGNHERQATSYTVVVQLSGRELDRFRTRVGAGVTKRVRQPVTPRQSGERLRLSFLLYKGQPPSEPTRENAYRTVHLRISVN